MANTGRIPGMTLAPVGRFLAGAGRLFAGPIFTKELRVASRRRRNYVLRAVYLGLLTLFVGITYQAVLGSRSSQTFTAYEMSHAAQAIVGSLAWFEFLLIPLIAVIIASTSINDEIYHGTLSTLLTTPMTSAQLVLGKLSSKMLQLVVLVAMTVPLLSVVRVLGGVPWDFVLASTCITLATAAFYTSLAILFSVLMRRAHATILMTLGTLFALYAVLPLMGGLALAVMRTLPDQVVFTVAAHLHPYFAMEMCTLEMASPGSLRGAPLSFSWVVHVGVMLLAAGAVTALAVRMVRRASLRKAFGDARGPGSSPAVLPLLPPPMPLQPISAAKLFMPEAPAGSIASSGPPPLPAQAAAPLARPMLPGGVIRPIIGSAIIWKEIHVPLLRHKVRSILGLCGCVLVTLISYALLASIGHGVLSSTGTHAVYAFAYLMIGLAVTSVLAATTISTEKETRALPVLLTTTLGDWQIVLGKAIGILRRSMLAWVFLAGHIFLFTLALVIHPWALLHVAMLLSWVLALHVSAGLYFSSRFKRTTTAVVMSLGLALALWAILPILIGLGFGHNDKVAAVTHCGNPFVQISVLVTGAEGPNAEPLFTFFGSGKRAPRCSYHWYSDDVGPYETTLYMLVWMILYGLIGLGFLWRAKYNLRKRIF